MPEPPALTSGKPPRAAPRWLGVLCVACAAASEPSGATSGGAPSEVALGSPISGCSDANCAALAGPCQEGRCDALTGSCRRSSTHEGMACLAGNPCGPAVCRSGECTPLAPPSCAERDDACQSGVCLPESGCVTRPRRLPGQSEETAVRLSASGIGSATASTSCSEAGAGPLGSTPPLSGPSAYFELDLTAARRATRVLSVIDAAFAFEAVLTRGPSADPAVLQRAAPWYQDGKSRRLEAELEPGLYHLVVTGQSASDRGTVHLASAVGELPCRAPDNDGCATPALLDGSLAQQTVLANLACATPEVPVRCADLAAPDVFYELDFSARSREVLLEVELDDASQGQVSLFGSGGPACSELTTCAERWSWRVSPGRRQLGLSASPRVVSDDVVAFRVRVSEDSCSGTSNDRPDTAIELDPTLTRQGIRGNTACAQDDFSGSCYQDRGSPDLFYRLDLRGRPAPQQLRVEGQKASGLGLYVLPATAAAGSSACSELISSAILAPRLYYLVLDGGVANAGAFTLELSLADAYAVPRQCQPRDANSESCLFYSQPACAISASHPDCLRAAVDCGLAPEVYSTFCATLPGCCDGTSPGDSCQAAWETASICKD